MTALSIIHPLRALQPGRYLLDDVGMLWPVESSPFAAVAAVVVKARAHLDPPPRPVEDPPTRSFARRPRPTPVQVPADEVPPPDDVDAIMAEFQAKLQAKRAERAKRAPATPEPAIDTARVAAAHRAKPRVVAQKREPTRRALGPGACHICGTRGTIGCDHFLPFQGSAA